MCQPTITPRYVGMQMCTCGCCGCGCGPPFRRLFSLREEQERLESYRDQLAKELAGVEERIKELKGK
ncbi:MAG: hypothetical protein JSV14_13415 [Deltaproteobacteria bacterium]|nr:MAG: hypothetical protein JSV14_13415 [Deltaproteobacteria bacterium]